MLVAIVLITEKLVERLVLGQIGCEQLGVAAQQCKRFRIQCVVPIRRRLQSVHVRQRTRVPVYGPMLAVPPAMPSAPTSPLPAAGTAWFRALSLPANPQSN